MSEETTTHTHDEATSAVPELAFGFAVVVDKSGNVFVERNTSVLSIPVEREATLLEVRRYVSEILIDLQAQSAAEYVAIKLAGMKPAVDAANQGDSTASN
jgi:hypothetical protein